MKNVRSTQPRISMNFCTEFSKTHVFPCVSLTAHVVFASVDKISRIGKGAYQGRKNRDYGKVWWRNMYQNWDEE